MKSTPGRSWYKKSTDIFKFPLNLLLLKVQSVVIETLQFDCTTQHLPFLQLVVDCLGEDHDGKARGAGKKSIFSQLGST